MFDTICTLPLDDDLFCQAASPVSPLLATGLASGHVSVYRLPSLHNQDQASGDSGGRGQIETAWRTRRHKSSCRSLAFTYDGSHLFSAGADGVIKLADVETGQARDKIAVPAPDASSSSTSFGGGRVGSLDPPSLIHTLSPQTLLVATDSSALHLYDLRVATTKGKGGDVPEGFLKRRPQQTHHPHQDYISSLTPLPPTENSTSGFSKQWVSTGGTTLAVTDLRRGVLVQSEDQEELLLSSAAVTGLSARGSSRSEKVLVGGGGGVLTLWERGQWDDQDERIVVDKGFPGGGGGESVDVLTVLPDGVGSGGKIVAVGLGDGRVRFVKIGPNKVVHQLRHDDVEGVVGIDFDVEGRLITGGGTTIKVWHEKVDEDNGAYVEDGEAPNSKLSIYDVDSENEGMDGTDSSGDASDGDTDDENEGSRRKKRQKVNINEKKGNGHLNGRAGSFSFAGLD